MTTPSAFPADSFASKQEFQHGAREEPRIAAEQADIIGGRNLTSQLVALRAKRPPACNSALLRVLRVKALRTSHAPSTQDRPIHLKQLETTPPFPHKPDWNPCGLSTPQAQP
jgi:hypothetical protein